MSGVSGAPAVEPLPPDLQSIILEMRRLYTADRDVYDLTLAGMREIDDSFATMLDRIVRAV